MDDPKQAAIDFPAIVALTQTGQLDAKEVWSRLDDNERQAYLAAVKEWSKGRGERTRQDNSLFGLPPEIAAVGLAPKAMQLLGMAGTSIAGMFKKPNLIKEAAEDIGVAERPSIGGGWNPANLERYPSNIDTRHTLSDTMEQVGKGVQNDFRGPVSFQRPGTTLKSPVSGAKGAKFAETSAGADELDAILEATGRKGAQLNPNGMGTLPAEPGDAFSRSEKLIHDLLEGPMKKGDFSSQLKASVKRRSPKK